MGTIRRKKSVVKAPAFQRFMGRLPGRQYTRPFTIDPVTKPKALDPGALFHYWYPGRDGVEPAPEWFAAQLAQISPDLACVRPPAGAPIRSRCWLVWYRKPSVTYWLSPGWMLICAWHTPDKAQTPLPLDNRLLANLYLQSLQGGRSIIGRAFDSAKEYFETIVSRLMREKQANAAADKRYVDLRRKSYWDYTRIKNIGHGSKFALHHDGTVVPGRTELGWLVERGNRDLPKEVAEDQRVASRKMAVADMQHAYQKAALLQSAEILDRLHVMQDMKALRREVEKEYVRLKRSLRA